VLICNRDSSGIFTSFSNFAGKGVVQLHLQPAGKQKLMRTRIRCIRAGHGTCLDIVDVKKLNNMKITAKPFFAVLATGLLSCGLFCPPAQAIPIKGNITFSGGVKFDSRPNNVNAAHEVELFIYTAVTSADGSFTGLNGSAATFASEWAFTAAQPKLWSVGGYTFALNAGAIVSQGNGFINISGTGTISGNGFTPTAGTFAFSSQNSSSRGTFSFSASGTSAAVPDGGSAVGLLGIALAGIEIVRRKIKAA
jgi:hypothetical protein